MTFYLPRTSYTLKDCPLESRGKVSREVISPDRDGPVSISIYVRFITLYVNFQDDTVLIFDKRIIGVEVLSDMFDHLIIFVPDGEGTERIKTYSDEGGLLSLLSDVVDRKVYSVCETLGSYELVKKTCEASFSLLQNSMILFPDLNSIDDLVFLSGTIYIEPRETPGVSLWLVTLSNSSLIRWDLNLLKDSVSYHSLEVGSSKYLSIASYGSVDTVDFYTALSESIAVEYLQSNGISTRLENARENLNFIIGRMNLSS
jgi:hypothetical protein